MNQLKLFRLNCPITIQSQLFCVQMLYRQRPGLVRFFKIPERFLLLVLDTIKIVRREMLRIVYVVSPTLLFKALIRSHPALRISKIFSASISSVS